LIDIVKRFSNFNSECRILTLRMRCGRTAGPLRSVAVETLWLMIVCYWLCSLLDQILYNESIAWNMGYTKFEFVTVTRFRLSAVLL